MAWNGNVDPKTTKATPEQVAEIRAKLRNLNLLSFAFAIPGLVLWGIGVSQREDPKAEFAPLFLVAGMGLLAVGFALYARMKNRSPLWGLMGLLGIIGLIVLAVVGKRCHRCKAMAGGSAKACGCGAPM